MVHFSANNNSHTITGNIRKAMTMRTHWKNNKIMKEIQGPPIYCVYLSVSLTKYCGVVRALFFFSICNILLLLLLLLRRIGFVVCCWNLLFHLNAETLKPVDTNSRIMKGVEWSRPLWMFFVLHLQRIHPFLREYCHHGDRELGTWLIYSDLGLRQINILFVKFWNIIW